MALDRVKKLLDVVKFSRQLFTFCVYMCNSLSEATHRHQLQHSGHRMLYTLEELTPFGSEIRLLRLDAYFAFGWNLVICHSGGEGGGKQVVCSIVL